MTITEILDQAKTLSVQERYVSRAVWVCAAKSWDQPPTQSNQ